MAGGGTSLSTKEFDQFFANMYRIFGLIGMNLYDPNFRLTRASIYTLSVSTLGTLQIVYFLWVQRSEVMPFLVIVPYAMFAVIGLHKIFMVLMWPEGHRALRAKSSEILQLLNENDSNDPIMWKSFRIVTILQRLLVIMYGISVAFVVCMPIAIYSITGEKVLIILFRVPWIDKSTTEGFLANLALHTMMMPPAFLGYLGIDSLFLAMVFPVSAYVDALANEVREINSMLEQPERDETAIKDKLNRVSHIHQLLIEYESMLKTTYDSVVLVKIGAIILGMICNIVVIFNSNHHMAYFFNMILLALLTQYCMLGTVITVKNEQLLNHLYDIKWYLLRNNQTKHLALMLLQAQNAPSITIGIFAPLDVESYVAILKTIYSYVMILFTFLE